MTEDIAVIEEPIVEAKPSENDSSQALVLACAIEDTAKVAFILESMPIAQRHEQWYKIPENLRLDVLTELRGEPKKLLIRALPEDELVQLVSDIEAEDLLEIDDALPDQVLDRAMAQMDTRQRQFYEQAQEYPEDTVGHWVDHNVLVIPQTSKPRESLRILRRDIPELTEVIYLVNRVGQWKGCIHLTHLATAQGHTPVSDLTIDDFPVLEASMAITDACNKVVSSGFSALPVINDQGVLLGRLTLQDAAEHLLEDTQSRAMSSAGLDDDADLFAPVIRSSRTRAIWLGINLLTALLASWFIGLFQATLEKVVVLAVLMPIVASMGGIAGSQTLTLIVRGLALGQVSAANAAALIKKELSVGGLNGVLWAIIIGVVAVLWFDDAMIGVVIAGAILTNIIFAALSGVLIPLVLKRVNIDPALSGSVILTTVTDIVGFVSFLGLGSLLLVN